MKALSTMFVAGTLALTLATPVLDGSVGVSRSYATAEPNPQTIADLENASDAAQREARTGNKNNVAFGQKSYQIDQLIERLKDGQQVSENQIDQALLPVVVW